jgi:hypothetical protein
MQGRSLGSRPWDAVIPGKHSPALPTYTTVPLLLLCSPSPSLCSQVRLINIQCYICVLYSVQRAHPHLHRAYCTKPIYNSYSYNPRSCILPAYCLHIADSNSDSITVKHKKLIRQPLLTELSSSAPPLWREWAQALKCAAQCRLSEAQDQVPWGGQRQALQRESA